MGCAEEKLVRVVTPYFVAGLIVRDGRVVEAAPILRKKLLGATEDGARLVIKAHGWKATICKT